MARPCPYVGCRYNLFLDVNEENGSIRFNHPEGVEPWDVPKHASCALDVADEGLAKYDVDVARLIGKTKERTRQILIAAREAAAPGLKGHQ